MWLAEHPRSLSGNRSRVFVVAQRNVQGMSEMIVGCPVDKLNAEAVAAYLAPNVKTSLELQGYQVAANTLEEFAQFIKLDIARIVALVKRYGIRPE